MAVVPGPDVDVSVSATDVGAYILPDPAQPAKHYRAKDDQHHVVSPNHTIIAPVGDLIYAIPMEVELEGSNA